jgi:hypothetical protein
MRRHPIYMWVWYLANVLLAVSILLLVCATVWEYSTRKYLEGFSDAVIPLEASSEQKVEAILFWMEHGPTRLSASSGPLEYQQRDPATTLNYDQLLRACGTATNAFVNLSNISRVPARRLLLMGTNWSAKHVVAEVQLDDRWVVVDPTFRAMFRGADGHLLTREELLDPDTFTHAIERIPRYPPDYSFEKTAHVRVPKLPYIGTLFRSSLNRLSPDWSDSVFCSLLFERESFAASVSAILLVVFLLLARIALRWLGERSLGIHMFRARANLAEASRALIRGRS